MVFAVKKVPENLVVILIITTFAEGYSTSSYRLMVGTAKYMDKWFLDPILGFILPAGIAVLCWLIYLIISWAISLSTWAYDWIVSLF